MDIRNIFFGKYVPQVILEQILVARTSGSGFSLMYHEILPDNFSIPAWTVVSESSFRNQMLFLKKFFRVISIEESIYVRKAQKNGMKPYVVITFDDGYRGNYSCALPIIEELQIPATFYISSGAIESGGVYWHDRIISLLSLQKELKINLSKFGLRDFNINSKSDENANWCLMQNLLTALKTLSPQMRAEAVHKILSDVGETPQCLQMMNTHELKQLSMSPFVTIGGHTHNHEILPQLSDTELTMTIEKNIKKLTEWTNHEIKHFSYPNGDFNTRVISTAKRAGYVSAVTTQNGLWAKNSDPFRLPRIGVGRFDSHGLFISKIALAKTN